MLNIGKACVATGLSAMALALTAPVAVASPADMEGRAAAAATVTRGQARFTVLTSGFIRMEWSPAARFVDAPSQVFIDRDQPNYPGIPTARQITVEFPAASLTTRASVNGVAYSRSDDQRSGHWHYEGASITARVVVSPQAATAPMTVKVDFAFDSRIEGLSYRVKRTAAAVARLKEHWPAPEPLPDDISLAGQFGQLADYDPDRLSALVSEFDLQSARLVMLVQTSRVSAPVKAEFARRMALILH